MKRVIMVCLALSLVLGGTATAEMKTLRLALASDPETLDIQQQLSGNMLEFSHWVFDPLVRYAQDMSFEPRLAEKWEQIDPLTIRFHLVKGVKFHSGNPFTAKDVVFTVNRMKQSVDFKGLFEAFETPVIVDDYTVDIKTNKPYSLVLNMATYIFPLDSVFYTGTDEKGQPKDAVVKAGYSFANETLPSGTGPYRCTFREQGVRMELERNPDYWDKNSPGNIGKVILTPIKEEATRVAALLSGDVDFIYPVPPQDFDRIDKDPKVNLFTYTGGRIITVQMNQNRLEAFKDPRVRQAINLATNNVGIAEKIMRGTATPAGQLSPKGYAGHDPALVPQYDLAKAQALMKEAGYENGFEASMIATNNRYVNDEKIAEAFAAMMAKINIKVNLKTIPKAQYWDEFDKQVADFQLVGWHSDTEDSGNFYEFLAMCPNKETGYGQYNSGNYCNPEVDRLTLACQTETDLTKRIAMLKQIEKILYDEAFCVYFHWQNHSYGAAKGLDVLPIVNVMNFPYIGDLVWN
ncbi:MAG: ABC transporter substrate-binding protein [Desulfobacterales bacterium]|nr:ABC transporter substrate-binding protein [Desulfobacteraceae bacterium]MDY0310677.1 ABC transporter substrate-binding protein [Desulfobacterales bacterium]